MLQRLLRESLIRFLIYSQSCLAHIYSPECVKSMERLQRIKSNKLLIDGEERKKSADW